MTENLETIKKIGLDLFVQNEYEKWVCNTCGGMTCVHTGYCLNCHAV